MAEIRIKNSIKNKDEYLFIFGKYTWRQIIPTERIIKTQKFHIINETFLDGDAFCM